MGDHNSGGGGSVTWRTEAKRVKKNGTDDPKSAPNGREGWSQSGVDEDGAAGDWFTVSIKVPAGLSPSAYLDALKSADNELRLKLDSERVYFSLKIERLQPEQIRISWGLNNPNVRAGSVV